MQQMTAEDQDNGDTIRKCTVTYCENSHVDSGPDLDTTISASDASKAEEGEFAPAKRQLHHESPQQRSSHKSIWRYIVRNFTPSWFVVNMGTGISSILLHNLPYNGIWLRDISYIIFGLNVLLFGLFLLISILRYTLYPNLCAAMIRHPTQSLFVGCFPMGLATIIMMICYVCVPKWDGNWAYFAWALWWIDVALAMAACCYMPFTMMRTHKVRVEEASATWLLPIISTIVASGAGSVVATVLPRPEYKLITLHVSYVLWGMGVPLSTIVMVIYFTRLINKGLVPKEAVVSSFIPLGPFGMGGFAIQQLGTVARGLFHDTHTLPDSVVYAGDILYVCGYLVALLMWGFGLIWLFFAVATVWHTQRFPFNMSWWSCTFPIGVYAVSTLTLAEDMPSAFFRILGMIFSILEVLLWIVVSCGTCWKIWKGKMFDVPDAPDLGTAERRSQKRPGPKVLDRDQDEKTS